MSENFEYISRLEIFVLLYKASKLTFTKAKTDDEERCFLKQFGFIPHYLGKVHLFWVAEKATKIDENIPLVSLKAT